MATIIRLRREGGRNKPFFRVVVTDKRSPRDGKFIELLGIYNPRAREGTPKCQIKMDRAEFWLQRGAQISVTVRDLIRKVKDQPAETAAADAQPSAAIEADSAPNDSVAAESEAPVSATA